MNHGTLVSGVGAPIAPVVSGVLCGPGGVSAGDADSGGVVGDSVGSADLVGSGAPLVARGASGAPAQCARSAPGRSEAWSRQRAEFDFQFRFAREMIRTGVWPVPPEAWVAQMVMLAGAFERAFAQRVALGLDLAIRLRPANREA